MLKSFMGEGKSGYRNPPTSLPPCHKINDDRSFVVTIMTMIKNNANDNNDTNNKVAKQTANKEMQ